MKYLVFIALSIVGLSGCSQLVEKTDVHAGQVFQLTKPIEIQADTTRRFIQHGELTSRFAFDRREQHCRLEVRTLTETARTVNPDHFIITRVRFDSEAIAMRPQMLAAGFGFNLSLAMDDDGPAEMMDLILMDLESPHQPDVMRLVCAGALSDGDMLDYPRNLRPMLDQIHSILGDYGRIK